MFKKIILFAVLGLLAVNAVSSLECYICDGDACGGKEVHFEECEEEAWPEPTVTTNPPVTKDPTGTPPVTTDPPVTKDPTGAPPVTTDPPVTKDPTGAPPVTTDPPVTKDPTGAPPVTTDPPVTKNPTVAPPVTKDPTGAPPVTDDDTGVPSVTDDDTGVPSVTDDDTGVPSVTDDDTDVPSVTDDDTKPGDTGNSGGSGNTNIENQNKPRVFMHKYLRNKRSLRGSDFLCGRIVTGEGDNKVEKRGCTRRTCQGLKDEITGVTDCKVCKDKAKCNFAPGIKNSVFVTILLVALVKFFY